MCVRERECVCVRERVCVCVRERERVCVGVSVCISVHLFACPLTISRHESHRDVSVTIPCQNVLPHTVLIVLLMAV